MIFENRVDALSMKNTLFSGELEVPKWWVLPSTIGATVSFGENWREEG